MTESTYTCCSFKSECLFVWWAKKERKKWMNCCLKRLQSKANCNCDYPLKTLTVDCRLTLILLTMSNIQVDRANKTKQIIIIASISFISIMCWKCNGKRLIEKWKESKTRGKEKRAKSSGSCSKNGTCYCGFSIQIQMKRTFVYLNRLIAILWDQMIKWFNRIHCWYFKHVYPFDPWIKRNKYILWIRL